MALESQIQSKIIRKLREQGWMVIKLIKTNCNGIPDLLIHRHGATCYIEVKRPGQSPTALQQYRMKELAAHGITCITVINVDECLEKLLAITSRTR
jgi:Holliday junction resolvase